MSEPKERWRELCEHAVGEQDPQKFLATIEELIEELEAKEQEVKHAGGRTSGIRKPDDRLPTR